MTWKIVATSERALIEQALARQEAAADWDSDIVVGGSEVAEDQPERWLFEAWLPRQPDDGDLAAISALFPAPAPRLTVEALPDADWVAQSQAGMAPIVAGRFRVRTPDHPPLGDPGRHELVIPASQAFGTGQHATTAGCLEMLTGMAERGIAVANFADIGTGTGLLAFAACQLWPAARGIASDIDPVCATVLAENAALNHVPLGSAAGELAVVIADGLEQPGLRDRAPYDLIVANILAAPLIALADEFAAALSPAGQVVLAGLLTSQEQAVTEAYAEAGLALAERLVRGDWAILRLSKQA